MGHVVAYQEVLVIYIWIKAPMAIVFLSLPNSEENLSKVNAMEHNITEMCPTRMRLNKFNKKWPK